MAVAHASPTLYERIGDLNAYIQVQRHFQHLLDATVRHNGAVTKTIGDAVMAAFSTSADAVQAALDMREAVDELNRDRAQRDFILKIGVHRGASIAVTLNERLDYFGQTVNIAARVQGVADSQAILVTKPVVDNPQVSKMLEGSKLAPAAQAVQRIVFGGHRHPDRGKRVHHAEQEGGRRQVERDRRPHDAPRGLRDQST